MIEFIQWDNRSWEKQATTSIFLLHLAFKSQGFVGFQCMCQSMNSGINLFVPWSAAALSFYKGQSRSRGWCPVFSVHREDEDCVFEQNGALGATALKKGSCEPMFVVSASCLASAIAGLIWEIIKSPLNPFFFFLSWHLLYFHRWCSISNQHQEQWCNALLIKTETVLG